MRVSSSGFHVKTKRDAWSLLFQARGAPASFARRYRDFIALVAEEPVAIQDMLLAEANRVFKIRLRVLRADLRQYQGGAR